MKDESYIKKTIEHLRLEKNLHAKKFAGNQAHLGCAANFDRAIQNLEHKEYVVAQAATSWRSDAGVEAKSNAINTRADSAGSKVAFDEPADYTEAGDIGDEQMPAGEIKTDKKAWSYDASKNLGHEIPRKVKEFMAGL